MCKRTLSVFLLCLSGWGRLAAVDVYVSPSGQDQNPGTREQPFKTIQRAAAMMQPGDHCVLRGGTYRETVKPPHSGAVGKPLVFSAFPGERVTVSGADELKLSWTPHQGGVYRAGSPVSFGQLFLDGQMLAEACWPKPDSGQLFSTNRSRANVGTGYEILADPALPPGDWNGGTVLIWPGEQWNNSTRHITNYEPGLRFRFDRDFRPLHADTLHGFDPFQPKKGNPYRLYGSLAAVTAPGDWFQDAATKTVYFYPPAGQRLEHLNLEVKQRNYAFDLEKLSFIELRGLQIFAAGLNLTGAEHCRVEDCHLRYVNHAREIDGYRKPSVNNFMTGQSNVWERCSITGAALSGIEIAGVGNQLRNCVIQDCDYLGAYASAVHLNHAVGAVLEHNTIRRAGRELVEFSGSRQLRLAFNDFSGANLLSSDSGALKCWGTDGQGTVIAYNWVHDNLGPNTVGVYLDNFSTNFVIHHNLIFNNSNVGIRLNSDSISNLVCNNTVVKNRAGAFGVFTYPGKIPSQQGTRIINNLVTGKMDFVKGELAPMLEANGEFPVDAQGLPTPGSGAVDAGVNVPGITSQFSGKAPDIGAYESGAKPWQAGADWLVK